MTWYRLPMKWTDTIRLTKSRLQRKTSVLFSRKDDWNQLIGESLIGYVPFCYDFASVNVNRYSVLFPLTVHDSMEFNRHHRHLHGVSALVPTTDVIELCKDKLTLMQRLDEYGFGEHLPAYNQTFDFPYVLKRRHSAFGKGTNIIASPSDEEEHASDMAAETHMTQEHIPGTEEFATHAIMAHGRIVFSRTVKYFFPPGLYVKGSQCFASRRETFERTPFLDIFEAMLRSLNYEGICCLDYKVIDNKPKLMEINPRFGATMTLFINEALQAYEEAIASF